MDVIRRRERQRQSLALELAVLTKTSKSNAMTSVHRGRAGFIGNALHHVTEDVIANYSFFEPGVIRAV